MSPRIGDRNGLDDGHPCASINNRKRHALPREGTLLFTLPGETLVYPAHDYEGRCVSSIAKEKQRNPRLGDGKPLQVFMDIMGSMDLPYPKFIDFALPGNRACGVCPEDIPEHLQEYCQQISNSRQG
jgi:hypothetical protein